MGNEKFKSFKELDIYIWQHSDAQIENANEIKNLSKKDKLRIPFEQYKDLPAIEKKKYLEKRGISFSHLTAVFYPEKNIAAIPCKNPFTGAELTASVIPCSQAKPRKPRKDGRYRVKGYLTINTAAQSGNEILLFKEGKANVSDSVSKKQKKQIQSVIKRGIIVPIQGSENMKANHHIYLTNLTGAKWEDLAEFKEDEKIYFNDFVATMDSNYCTQNHHNIEPITALIFILKKNGDVMPKKVPASFCKSCRRYYLSRWQYENLCEYGKPLCQLVKQYVHKEDMHNSYYNTLNAESKLHVSGYNVGSAEELSEAQRHTLLTFIIESGLCEKHEILTHLSWLINSRQGQANMGNAVDKWKKDRDFVDSYKMGANRTVGIRLIRHTIYR